jgi:hypothetical protein
MHVIICGMQNLSHDPLFVADGAPIPEDAAIEHEVRSNKRKLQSRRDTIRRRKA